MCGATIAGFCEIFLTLAKCAPLVLIPLVALFSLHTDYFFPLNPANLPPLSTLNTATLMTFWGFIGLETATTTASLINNPAKTIPRAILTGTLLVATIYFLNSFAIMGILPPATLSTTQAPYADAAHILFGGSWTLPMSLLAFIVCIGTLNAWVLTSGQIALEAARAHLFPALFSLTTRTGAPYISLLISYLCTLPLLFLTLTPNILTQLNFIIDLSVTAFVFIYLACTLSYLTLRPSTPYILIALLATAFCLWILLFTSLLNLLLCTLFVLTGLPIYLYQKRALAQQPNS
jgi:APA family basic amino acid/polyamine antiporter